ncbi:putative transcription factor C2H2 family [Lupinus albus]|uniref:RING-type E3 ubiquitin transferase n=1 Tax=Lupinus albus TaxID=3870 RepID=A0A6A4Q152_LUPAL|nr:putative transcription factor C2H2 family [Lupinus albus]
MPIVTQTTTKTKVVTENMKWRKPRNQINITETDPNLQTPSLTQSTPCKSTISSFLLSTFSNNNNNNENIRNRHHSKKKTNFSASSTFRGLGCTAGAPQEVSVPAMIRSSADWDVNKKKLRKKKYKSTKNTNVVISEGSNSNNNLGYVDFQDVWCGPGIGFSTDAASIDHVVTRKNVSSRGKIDVEKLNHGECSSYLGRRPVTPETISFLDTDPDIFAASDSFGPAAPYYCHIQDPSSDDSSDGFAEILLQGGLLMGGRLTKHDRFRGLRLNIDNMSYEQLLDLGERIGYVNAGLKEDEMGRNIRKTKFKFSHDASKNQVDKKCTICQEEYEADDELGKLNCKHSYHFRCIKQWVAQKNFCPVCKQQVVARR